MYSQLVGQHILLKHTDTLWEKGWGYYCRFIDEISYCEQLMVDCLLSCLIVSWKTTLDSSVGKISLHEVWSWRRLLPHIVIQLAFEARLQFWYVLSRKKMILHHFLKYSGCWGLKKLKINFCFLIMQMNMFLLLFFWQKTSLRNWQVIYFTQAKKR